MSSATTTLADRVIYRRSVMFCVLPVELGWYLEDVKHYYEGVEDFEVVVERRGAPDRRAGQDGAPGGVERRLGERREAGDTQTAAVFELELPRALRRQAGRIVCTWRELPVHLKDADQEADELLAAADTDGVARDELRLRYYPRVHSAVRTRVAFRDVPAVTENVFDDLFAHHGEEHANREVTRATSRVIAGR